MQNNASRSSDETDSKVVRMKTKKALTQTTEDYASRTTIHGISYVFDRELGFVDRALWLLLVLASLGGAAYFTWNFWTQWKDNQVGRVFQLAVSSSKQKFHFVGAAH